MHSIRCGLLLPTSRPEGCVSVIVTRLSVCLVDTTISLQKRMNELKFRLRCGDRAAQGTMF